MKTFLALLAIIAATLVVTPHATACDGVAALGTGCYSQNIRQRVKIIERVAAPQYQIVERIEVPQYVERQQIIEKQYVPAERIVERQKIVVQRQRGYGLLSAPARVVERLSAPRARVIQRQRIVERSVY